MISISSHVLDSTSGTHAAGIRVKCFRYDAAGKLLTLFDQNTDEQGRFSEQIALSVDELPADIQLEFDLKAYFEQSALADNGPQIMEVISIKLSLSDADSKHHIPIMLSPHSYSVWWSAPQPA